MKFAMQTALMTIACVVMPAMALDQRENTIRFLMPSAGRGTIAINDAQGKRVRNLLADLPYQAGEQSVEWDGRNDAGELMPPGSYQWVGLYRGDLHAVYRGSFQHGNPPWPYGKTGGWIADHSPAVTIVRVGDRMILGATESEWGHGIIASDLSGQKLWGVKHMEKRGWAGADMLATGGDRVFATSYLGEKAIWEIDPQSGENHLVVEQAQLPAATGTDSKGDSAKDGVRIIGAHDGEVYAVQLFADEPRTLVFKMAKPFERLVYDRTLPVRPWQLAWLGDGRCLAVMDKTVEILDTKTGGTTPLISAGLSQPHSITVDATDRIYVSDQGATGVHRRTPAGQLPWRYMRLEGPAVHQVKVFDATGKFLAAIGAEGGQQVGKFDPEAFFMPSGLAIDGCGHLWVTEMNYLPKRVTVWAIPDDPGQAKAKLQEQFIGPAMYGGGAAMIDPKQPWRIMDTSYGEIFDVNLAKGDYRVASVPWRHHDPWKEQGYRPEMPFTGRPGVIIEVDGRKFTATQGGYMHGSDANWSPYSFKGSGGTMIGEYVGEGDDIRFVPRAAIANIRMWMRGRELKVRREEQWLPAPILDAARRLPDWPKYAESMGMDPDAPDVPHVEHKRGSKDWIVHPWPKEISGLIWTDGDGDGRMQAEEVRLFAFGDAEQVTLDPQLNVYLPVASWQKDFAGLWMLLRAGFNEVGAPVYRPEDLKHISDTSIDVAEVGADGSLLAQTALHSPDGNRIWSYPSSPKGVKALGPQSADSLKPGRINRVNSLWGVASGPGDLGEVYMLHNNDGMVYLLTRADGLFIGSLFRPYAFADGWDSIPTAVNGLVLDQYSLQDECFNGHFTRAAVSGKGFEAEHYYLLGLGRSAVVEITGLDSVHRLPGGDLQLSDGVGAYGHQERLDPTAGASTLRVRKTVQPIVSHAIQAGTDTFVQSKATSWANATVLTAWDSRGIHMKWEIKGDKTPFVNNESDFTQLFSTGDACDVQLDVPTLGRLRFVVAMHGKTPAIIRMRYDGTPGADAITYRSGVAEIKVPEVIKLAGKPSVRTIKDGYIVQFLLPWRDLGIEKPNDRLTLPIELAVFSSDSSGTNTISRNYWASGTSEMVADVPTEARPTPKRGQLELQP